MGCDGGTIPRRDELVRVKKKAEQKDKDADREFRWLHCALTQQRLQEPIVMCGLGRLYSKQNVIEQLLEKDKMPESAKHIKSMKDIRTLNLTPNPAFTDEDKTEGLLDTRHAPYICKLIGLEMSGKFRFIGLWSCGCVISERALKQIKGTTKVCPLCQIEFSVEDVIVLNGGEEDLELMKIKIEMRNAKRKKAKKAKSINIKTEESQMGALNDGASTSKATEQCKEVNEEKNGEEENGHKTGIASSSNSALGKNNHQNNSNVKTKPQTNLTKRSAIAADTLQDPELKRLKSEYSVARDPKASETYKSLFTSHKSEKEQTRAHWVTYNPFYN